MLDASAVLALINDEPGAKLVADSLGDGVMSTANVAEVVGKLVDAGLDAKRVVQLLAVAGVRVEPLTQQDAELAGALRAIPGGRSLSLGDRCCLALTVRIPGGEVLTADRAWSDLGLPLQVHLIR